MPVRKHHGNEGERMAKQNEPPYAVHIFVCTNDRQGERKSCADGNTPLIKKALKEGVAERGWKRHVRVSQSGCLGLCAKGPNVILYPQKIWFSEVLSGDVKDILSRVGEILGETGAL